MAAVTVVDQPILDAIKSTLTADVTHGWVLAGYKDVGTVVFQASGKGDTSEMIEHLKDDQVQYVLIRVPDSKDGVATVRDVLISWTGPNVKIMEKAKKKTHIGVVKTVMQPHHADLEALSKANFTEAVVIDRSKPLSGSHIID